MTFSNILQVQCSASLNGRPVIIDRGTGGVLKDVWGPRPSDGHKLTLNGKPISVKDAALWMNENN